MLQKPFGHLPLWLLTVKCDGASGIWLKDEQASDMKAYERSLSHCMRMGGLQKETAMRLFEGMEIQQQDDKFHVRYLTVVPFFQVSRSGPALISHADGMGRPPSNSACLDLNIRFANIHMTSGRVNSTAACIHCNSNNLRQSYHLCLVDVTVGP